jgi:hypothetical protein
MSASFLFAAAARTADATAAATTLQTLVQSYGFAAEKAAAAVAAIADKTNVSLAVAWL